MRRRHYASSPTDLSCPRDLANELSISRMGSNRLFYLAAARRECVCAYAYARHMPSCWLWWFFLSSSSRSLGPRCPLCVTAVDGASLHPPFHDGSIGLSLRSSSCLAATTASSLTLALAWFCLVNWPRGMSTADPTDFCSILFSVRPSMRVLAAPASICRSATSLPPPPQQ